MTWVAVDIETSGLSFVHHEIIEVGIAGYRLTRGTDELFSVAFSLAFDEEAADPEALEVNGWGVRQFAPLVYFREAADIMELHFRDSQIVASPTHFDIGFLTTWHEVLGFKVPWGHRDIIDLKSYAQGRWGEQEPLRNSTIAGRLGVEDTSDHTALGDAIWTAKLFKALTTP